MIYTSLPMPGTDRRDPGRERTASRPNSANGIAENNHVDETTALLGSDTRDYSPSPDGDSTDEDVEGKPLPKVQILLLCYARIIEPLAFFSIFPYVNQMIQSNGGIADTDVGFYSGLIEPLFSLTQAIVMIFWGRAADRSGAGQF